MDEMDEHRPHETPDAEGGHPSQAEGEDPACAGQHPDPALDGHPSQAEGEDTTEDTDG
ncbi:hypothetical protein [Microbacterium tenebrionis]|uniref:hypothetical protein n=1 Tax=Microbacterium tenebrionis TaxID=2830665 RepID=UPI0015896091|nr:hypothetical protein [Microbacterium ihumii]